MTLTLLQHPTSTSCFITNHNRNKIHNIINRHGPPQTIPSLHMKSNNGGAYNNHNNHNNNNTFKYIRIDPKTSRSNSRTFELQTAIATFIKKSPNGDSTSIIDLYSQLHFGEERYFSTFNQNDFYAKYDSIFYELVVSDDMLYLRPDGNKVMRTSTNDNDANNNMNNNMNKYPNPIAPPPSDEALANNYGLQCQVNIIDYTKPKYIHADTTREQL